MKGEEFDVKALRERLGWSREKLASELSVSAQSIYRWEAGRTKPLPTVVRQLEALERRADREGKARAA